MSQSNTVLLHEPIWLRLRFNLKLSDFRDVITNFFEYMFFYIPELFIYYKQKNEYQFKNQNS